ncbi:MAG: tRNA uridine-5-carboxymethylaminomethyl(34) synthesis enzyme MnmG [Candidatus Riflebacteria bacterium]|nr:tRNA uridine-5-carboxymethylaminomethyl(34) synthesis enzyme MnmG [Candidatus Riflebacteria bacterium]
MSPPAPVIIVGAGHAGCEAALAAARAGAETLLLTLDLDTVAAMPCNPSVGGQGKGQLVREIDALGGAMGRVADATALQARLLNTRKGCAVQAIRVQSDKEAYGRAMRAVLGEAPRLRVAQAEVVGLVTEDGRVTGVRTRAGEDWPAAAVVLAPGTFLRGMIHLGAVSFPGGRAGEPPADELGAHLAALGLPLRRFKTGTPPRIDGRTIDVAGLERQDDEPGTPPFSLWSAGGLPDRRPCFLTHTGPETHDVIRAHLHESALIAGRIKGVGPRYCPSIEDKVSRFPDKERHKVFLEPEGAGSCEIYLQGLSTSLPEAVQELYVRTLPGLGAARLTRPGYGIEYDIVDPATLLPTLESKLVRGLFLAGQINGTSGYEEAAAQGLLAGANAAALALGRSPTLLDPDRSFAGLMIEEITTQPLTEPYRVFTSRSPFRLRLRMSNAEERLTDIGVAACLVGEERSRRVRDRQAALDAAERQLVATTVLVVQVASLGLPASGPGAARNGSPASPAGPAEGPVEGPMKGPAEGLAEGLAEGPAPGPDDVLPEGGAGVPRGRSGRSEAPVAGWPADSPVPTGQGSPVLPDGGGGIAAVSGGPGSPAPGGKVPLAQVLKRAGVGLADVERFLPRPLALDPLGRLEVEARIKYAGYLAQEAREVEVRREMAAEPIPAAVLADLPKGLSMEARLKVQAAAPRTLGELSRVPGVRASDVALIMMAVRRSRRGEG